MPLPRLRLLLLCAVVLGCGATLRAQSNELNFAIDQLKANGSLSFAKLIYPDDLDFARILADTLDRARTDAGDLMDWEIVDSRALSSRLTRLTLALHYEEFPIFLQLDVYVSAHETRFLKPKVSLELEQLLPPLDRQR